MTTKKDRKTAVHVPQVERLAAYWAGKGADPIAADQIARAQLAGLKQAGDGGHPGCSGNFIEILRGTFRTQERVKRPRRLRGTDKTTFCVSAKLQDRQFVGTTAGTLVGDLIDDPENCICIGEFSEDGRSWKQLFGKRTITSEFSTHTITLEEFPASSHVHIADHNMLMTMLTKPQLAFFNLLTKAIFMETSGYVPSEYGITSEAVPGNATFGHEVAAEIRRVKVDDCAVVQWFHHGLSVHSLSMERNAAMISELTRTLRLMLDALDRVPSPGLRTLNEATLLGLWKAFDIKLRAEHRKKILGLCRQQRQFTWADILAADPNEDV